MPIYHVVGADNSEDGRGGICPDLGYYEGTYNEVLAYVSKLLGWKNYNDVGTIEILKIKKVDKKAVEKEQSLLARKRQLEKDLQEIEEELS